MKPPLIGITTYAIDETNRFRIPRQYVDSVRQAGAIAVLIPPGEPSLDDLLSNIDGLLLAGGGDLDPTLYGAEPHESVYHVDTERDLSEIDLARRVVEKGFPTLAVCRGLQVLNVAFGGTLHVHLPDVVGDEIAHRLPPREPTEHAISVDAGTRLAEILGDTRFSAASWHHQAIHRVAEPLRVTAYAPDGVIEAAELPGHPWLIGVQWHPELTAERDEIQRRLFNAFVAAAARGRMKNRQ
jgi:putative glutamine amidotransferase